MWAVWRNSNVLAPLLCGAIFGATMIFSQFWIVGLAGLAAGISVVESAPSMRRALLRGYFFGLGFCAASLSFLLLAYPTDWLGLPGRVEGALLVVGAWLLCSIPVPLSVLPWAAGVHRFSGERFPLRLFAGATLWVLCEFLRSFFATLILWKPGLPVGAHIAFTLTGLTLSGSNGLLWFAYQGGFWSLALIAYVLAAFLAEGWRVWNGGHSAKALRYVLVVAIVFVLTYVVPPALSVRFGDTLVTVNDTTKVALVHTNFPRALSLDRETETRQAQTVSADIIAAAQGLGPNDLILLPEDTRYFQKEGYLSDAERTETRSAIRASGATFIDSGRSREGDVFYSAIIVKKQNEEAVQIHKTLLAAFGEYMPSIFAFLWDTAGLHEDLLRYEKIRGYEPAGQTFVPEAHTFMAGENRFGILACSEVLSTILYPLLGRNADVLLNISSLSVGNGSPLMFEQFLGMAKVHAATTGKPYLQATNFEPNLVIVPRMSSTNVAP